MTQKKKAAEAERLERVRACASRLRTGGKSPRRARRDVVSPMGDEPRGGETLVQYMRRVRAHHRKVEGRMAARLDRIRAAHREVEAELDRRIDAGRRKEVTS